MRRLQLEGSADGASPLKEVSAPAPTGASEGDGGGALVSLFSIFSSSKGFGFGNSLQDVRCLISRHALLSNAYSKVQGEPTNFPPKSVFFHKPRLILTIVILYY